MSFIQCFDKELKNKLLQSGFNLLSENDNFCIFENNQSTKFNFSELDNKQFVLTNRMMF